MPRRLPLSFPKCAPQMIQNTGSSKNVCQRAQEPPKVLLPTTALKRLNLRGYRARFLALVQGGACNPVAILWMGGLRGKGDTPNMQSAYFPFRGLPVGLVPASSSLVPLCQEQVAVEATAASTSPLGTQLLHEARRRPAAQPALLTWS